MVSPQRRYTVTWSVLQKWTELLRVYATCTYGRLNILQRLVVLLQFDRFNFFVGIYRKPNFDS